jgi:hypothetical protein
MLKIWGEYADGFVFLDHGSTDGTYEFLLENKEKFNILEILKVEYHENKLFEESNIRQLLYDTGLKYSNKILCLDTDEYLDGLIKKQQLLQLLDEHQDSLFYLDWLQYTDENKIRIDGKWQNHIVDRVASYSSRSLFKDANMHSEHIPIPNSHKTLKINPPHLFVAHMQWMDKRVVAIKQYYWKIFDYVNKLQFNSKIIDCKEYDSSVNEFNWKEIEIPFKLKLDKNPYIDYDYESCYKLNYIRENIKKFDIPNLNDWGMNIHV